MENINLHEIVTENDLQCPITGLFMLDPVSVANGSTYEREAITDWLKKSNKDPLTNAKLRSKKVTTNKLIRQLLNEYFKTYPDKISQRYILEVKTDIKDKKSKKSKKDEEDEEDSIDDESMERFRALAPYFTNDQPTFEAQDSSAQIREIAKSINSIEDLIKVYNQINFKLIRKLSEDQIRKIIKSDYQPTETYISRHRLWTLVDFNLLIKKKYTNSVSLMGYILKYGDQDYICSMLNYLNHKRKNIAGLFTEIMDICIERNSCFIMGAYFRLIYSINLNNGIFVRMTDTIPLFNQIIYKYILLACDKNMLNMAQTLIRYTKTYISLDKCQDITSIYLLFGTHSIIQKNILELTADVLYTRINENAGFNKLFNILHNTNMTTDEDSKRHFIDHLYYKYCQSSQYKQLSWFAKQYKKIIISTL